MATTLQTLLENSEAGDIYVLTKEGLAELTKDIFKNVNTRIQERIILSMDSESDNVHVPSANTVYNAIKSLSIIKPITVTSGNINEVQVAPDPRTLYVVRKSTNDTNAIMYIWIEGIGYVNCGGSSTTDASGITVTAISNEEIANIVSTSYQETDPGINDDEETE